MTERLTDEQLRKMAKTYLSVPVLITRAMATELLDARALLVDVLGYTSDEALIRDRIEAMLEQKP